MGLNQRSVRSKAGHSKARHSEAGHSEANYFEFEAKRASPVPSRGASEDRSEAASDREIPDQGCFDSHQEQIDKVVQSPLRDHDRMDTGRRYCLLITVHEATKKGYWALPKLKWNPANIIDMMKDDLDITEAVILDHIATILYVGR